MESVAGCNRVPAPPARIIPLRISSGVLKRSSYRESSVLMKAFTMTC